MATTYDAHELIAELSREVTDIIQRLTEVSALGEVILNRPPAPGKWSVAQIVEHMNTYDRYYIPYAERLLQAAPKTKGSTVYRPGWLGNYFVRAMYSDVKSAGKVTNSMSAMKGHIPATSLHAAAVIDEFIADQRRLLLLLDKLKEVDMAAVRVPITISRFITIKLGDALRFLVAHEVRHLLQLNNTLLTVCVCRDMA